ncbi:AMP-binding protein, partial [Jeotgalicoccus sp. S0W5]|uniref:AMP-binding protein n=1 Tax=Jeotgalicoccus sp. S0W5 TaxID=2527874 RepID=UPI001F10E775
MVEHQSLVNLVYHFKKFLGIENDDRMCQFANISFDASIEEIAKCLLNGATLYPVSTNVIYDYKLFKEFLNTHEITMATLPPTYLKHFERSDFPSLKRLIVAGSASTKELIEPWEDIYINAYGPTENTVGATMWKFNKEEILNTVPIGKPINNTKAYILNTD